LQRHFSRDNFLGWNLSAIEQRMVVANVERFDRIQLARPIVAI
jgi:hypothetical protein